MLHKTPNTTDKNSSAISGENINSSTSATVEYERIFHIYQ